MTFNSLKIALTAVAAALAANSAFAGELNLMKAAPAPVPTSTLWTGNFFLTRAFQDADLQGLINETNLDNCKHRNAARAQFSETARFKNSNCTKEYVYKKMSTTDLGKAAANRLAYRAANDLLSTSPVLRTLVEGKFSLDFSFNEIMEKVYVTSAPEARPEYVLEVVEKRVAVQGAHGTAKTGSAKEVVTVEKRIVERWPTIIASKSNEISTAKEGDSFAERVSKDFGLVHVPFTRYRLRVEKTAPGLGTDITLRFEEKNEMAFADVTQYLKGNKDGIAWGMRIPYKAHSVGFEYGNLKAEPVTFYRYYISDNTNAKLSYQAEVNNYGAEINWLL